MEKIKQLEQLIKKSNKIVFFGGAGVSTESGIPDFRSATGIYYKNQHLSPEQFISNRFFNTDVKAFYDLYKKHLIHLKARPNSCHTGLAKLEQMGRLICVITQNIDGLHQMAGSSNVIELHGTVHKNYCLSCNKFYGLEKILKADVPICECGGLIKPLVTLYGEALPAGVIEESVRMLDSADLIIVGGTSLVVQPAASLIYKYIDYKPIVLINKTEPLYPFPTTLSIIGAIGEIFAKINYEIVK